MKNILLASAIALATVSAAIAPTQAATVVIKTHDHMRMHHNRCRTKWVTTWRHHQKIVKKVTVCN